MRRTVPTIVFLIWAVACNAGEVLPLFPWTGLSSTLVDDNAADIRTAVDRLGGRTHAEREQAERHLVALGVAAETALRVACKSDDPEIAVRAKSALAQIGTQEERIAAFRESQRTPSGNVPLKPVRTLILDGKLTNACSMLEVGARDGNEEWTRSYVVACLALGQIDASTRVLQPSFRTNKHDAKLLALLSATNSDWTQAIAAAEMSDDNHVLEEVLVRAGEWKRLVDLREESCSRDTREHEFRLAEYARLAGDTETYSNTIDRIQEKGLQDKVKGIYYIHALAVERRLDKAIELSLALGHQHNASWIYAARHALDDLVEFYEESCRNSAQFAARAVENRLSNFLPIIAEKVHDMTGKGVPKKKSVPAKKPAELRTTPETALESGDRCAEAGKWDEAAGHYMSAMSEESDITEKILATYLYGVATTNSGNRARGLKYMMLATICPLADHDLRRKLAAALEKRYLYADAEMQFEVIARTSSFLAFDTPWRDCDAAIPGALRRRDYNAAADYAEMSGLAELIGGYSGSSKRGYATVCRIEGCALLAELADSRTNAALARLERTEREGFFIAVNPIPAYNIDLLREADRAGHKEIVDTLFERNYARIADACRRYPDGWKTHADLARLCAGARRRLSDGLRHANRAVELDPDNANAWVVLAKVYFRLGQTSKTIEALEKSVELDPYGPFGRTLDRIRNGHIDDEPQPY